MKFKLNFKGKLSIITKQDPNKGKGIFLKKNTQHGTFKFCRTYDCHNQITKSATNAKHFVDIYLKSVGKQVQGDKLEAHFTTQPIDISCSKDVPTEHNKDVLQNMIMRRSHHMEQPIEH